MTAVIRILLAVLLVGGSLHAKELDWKQLRPAPQSGVGCGFFANIPAVFLATDFEIQTSERFVRSVYCLRRGDFMFQRSFDKRMFYELFALPYKATEIEHPRAKVDDLVPVVRKTITEVFDKGLSENRVYSLRSRGIYGGPHNTLVMAKHGERYVVHNPYPGWIKLLTLDELAKSMIVPSTTEENRGKGIHVTHFLEISIPQRERGKRISMRSFPGELEVSLNKAQKGALVAAFASGSGSDRPSDLEKRIEAYPAIDFAALIKKGKLRNVIGADLPSEKLNGAVNLSKFFLNTWKLKKRPLLPVVYLKGKPWTLVSYRAFDPDHPKTPILAFENGEETLWLSQEEFLELFAEDGAMFGAVEVRWE
ncbi:MAG: hypothetical protein AAGI48_07735 [Verrucomicrobiota bacterium]